MGSTDLANGHQRKHGEWGEHIRHAQENFDQAQERVRVRTGRNLFAAIAIGLGLGALLVASLIFYHWLFIVFAELLVIAAAWEITGALRVAGWLVPRVPAVLISAAVPPFGFFWGIPGLWLATLTGGVLLSFYRILLGLYPKYRTKPDKLLLDIGASIFVHLYLGFLAGFYLVLADGEDGQWWVLTALIVVVTADVAAYVTGLSFGRRPMSPRISPKKTWEGFAGSALASMLAGVLLAWLMLGIAPWQGVVIGFSLMLVGTLGDLIESLIKRDLGVKDISGWLPGHGGFLDRLDSILPAGAVAYLLFVLFG